MCFRQNLPVTSLLTGDISMVTDCMLRLYTNCVYTVLTCHLSLTGDISMINRCMIRLYTTCVLDSTNLYPLY